MLKLSGGLAAGTALASAVAGIKPALAERSLAAPGIYEAVTPLGQSTVKLVNPTAGLTNLSGKTIGLVDVEFGGYRSQDFMRTVAALIKEKYPDAKVVELPSNVDGVWHSRPIDGTTGQVAKAAKIDAVIVGIGG